MIGYWRVLRRFNRNTRLFMVVPAAIGISYFGMFVVLFNLYLLRLGYDPRFIGALNAAGQVAFIVLSLPASRLGNRWGSRRPMVVAVILYLVGFGLLPLAEFVPEGARSVWLVVTFMIAFVGGPFYWVNSSMYLMGVTDPEVRSHAFSLRTALLPLAGFVGSLIGGWLPGLLADARGLSPAAVGPYRDALLLAALLYLPALLAMLRAGEAERKTPDRDTPNRDTQNRDQQPRNLSRAIPYGIILPLVVVDMMRLSAEVGLLGFFNVYLDIGLGAGTSRIGLIVGVALLIAGGAALATPLVSRRLGHRLTIMITMVGMAPVPATPGPDPDAAGSGDRLHRRDGALLDGGLLAVGLPHGTGRCSPVGSDGRSGRHRPGRRRGHYSLCRRLHHHRGGRLSRLLPDCGRGCASRRPVSMAAGPQRPCPRE